MDLKFASPLIAKLSRNEATEEGLPRFTWRATEEHSFGDPRIARGSFPANHQSTRCAGLNALNASEAPQGLWAFSKDRWG